jgi:hypothetical protein
VACQIDFEDFSSHNCVQESMRSKKENMGNYSTLYLKKHILKRKKVVKAGNTA